ncbi:MAG: nucleotide exchange factor GrpE [Bacteroidales bacterium]|jgi:molecular chaperone GrpE|nr:nucleotide exchange factor GrpE [Bacteroidales bacterium]
MEDNQKKSREMDEFEDIRIDENQTDEENVKQAAADDAQKPSENNNKRGRMRKDRKKHEEDTVSKETHDALNDKYLRLFSEFDNFRKRTLKEKIELSKTASEEVITALLPVLDDFERAIVALENLDQGGIKETLEGILLIYNKLLKTLQQKGLQEVEALHQTFDTDFHEAITNIPASKPELKGKVVDVVQKGYQLNGKVIRFAKVVVAN